MTLMRLRILFFLCLGAVLPVLGENRTYTGPEYIAGVKAARPKGGVYIRARLVQGSAVLQIQIKARNLPDGGNEKLVQVIFPKDRKGEALLLRSSHGGFSGGLFKPGQGVKALTAADRRLAVFGTDLTVEDLLADFLDWKQQKITGHEKMGAVPCVVIESVPDKGGKSPSKAVSWIDEKRYVPMRVQIFDGGDKPARIVDSEKIMSGSSGYFMPTTFTVTTVASGSKTTVDGSSSRADLNYTDADFSDQALQQVTPPPSGP